MRRLIFLPGFIFCLFLITTYTAYPQMVSGNPPGISSNQILNFRADSTLQKDDDGHIIAGTLLSADAAGIPPRWKGGKNYSLNFRIGTFIKWNANGAVTEGTLDLDYKLGTESSMTKTFKGGTHVFFDSEGLVSDWYNGKPDKRYCYELLFFHTDKCGTTGSKDTRLFISNVMDLDQVSCSQLTKVGNFPPKFKKEELTEWEKSEDQSAHSDFWYQVCAVDRFSEVVCSNYQIESNKLNGGGTGAIIRYSREGLEAQRKLFIKSVSGPRLPGDVSVLCEAVEVDWPVAAGNKTSAGNTGTETTESKSTPSTSSQTGYHIVEQGQTLYRISLIYHISTDELMRINNLSSASLTVGQKLKVTK